MATNRRKDDPVAPLHDYDYRHEKATPVIPAPPGKAQAATVRRNTDMGLAPGPDAVSMTRRNTNAGIGQAANTGAAAGAPADAVKQQASGSASYSSTPGGFVGDAGNFTYESAPQYVSQNQAAINELMRSIMGREPFEYDYTTDPRWQAYSDAYTREGQRAMENTLAQLSARTGGLASSYASGAAAQANNYYMQQMADKVPELYQAAYDMYMNEDNMRRQDLAAMLNQENMDRDLYRTQLGQYNTDRNFDYGVYSDEWNREYQAARDALADERWQTQWDYETGRDALGDRQQAFNTVMGLLGTVDPSTIPASMLEAAGLDPETAQLWHQQILAANAPKVRGTGGGGGGGGHGAYYSDVLKKAQSFTNPEESERYINTMVDAGFISEEEAAEIYLVHLGGFRYPTSYQEFVDRTGQKSIMTRTEFNQRKPQGYDSYQDYLNSMWAKYGK